jgi:hypothetical protein
VAHWRSKRGWKLDWKPLTDAELSMAKRSLFAWASLVDFSLPEELRAQVFEKSAFRVGACAGANESSFSQAMADAFLSESFPERLKAHRESVAGLRKGCRLAFSAFPGSARKEVFGFFSKYGAKALVLSDSTLPHSWLLEDLSWLEREDEFSRFKRKFMGLLLAAIATPQYLTQYERDEAATKRLPAENP